MGVNGRLLVASSAGRRVQPPHSQAAASSLRALNASQTSLATPNDEAPLLRLPEPEPPRHRLSSATLVANGGGDYDGVLMRCKSKVGEARRFLRRPTRVALQTATPVHSSSTAHSNTSTASSSNGGAVAPVARAAHSAKATRAPQPPLAAVGDANANYAVISKQPLVAAAAAAGGSPPNRALLANNRFRPLSLASSGSGSCEWWARGSRFASNGRRLSLVVIELPPRIGSTRRLQCARALRIPPSADKRARAFAFSRRRPTRLRQSTDESVGGDGARATASFLLVVCNALRVKIERARHIDRHSPILPRASLAVATAAQFAGSSGMGEIRWRGDDSTRLSHSNSPPDSLQQQQQYPESLFVKWRSIENLMALICSQPQVVSRRSHGLRALAIFYESFGGKQAKYNIRAKRRSRVSSQNKTKAVGRRLRRHFAATWRRARGASARRSKNGLEQFQSEARHFFFHWLGASWWRLTRQRKEARRHQKISAAFSRPEVSSCDCRAATKAIGVVTSVGGHEQAFLSGGPENER